jgi:hypothetical protein
MTVSFTRAVTVSLLAAVARGVLDCRRAAAVSQRGAQAGEGARPRGPIPKSPSLSPRQAYIIEQTHAASHGPWWRIQETKISRGIWGWEEENWDEKEAIGWDSEGIRWGFRFHFSNMPYTLHGSYTLFSQPSFLLVTQGVYTARQLAPAI